MAQDGVRWAPGWSEPNSRSYWLSEAQAQRAPDQPAPIQPENPARHGVFEMKFKLIKLLDQDAGFSGGPVRNAG